MAKCFSISMGVVARVTEVDACGRVIPGVSKFAVSDAIAKLGFAPTTEEGADLKTTSFTGAICASAKGAPTFTGYTVTGDFCKVDTGFLPIISNEEEYKTGDEAEALGLVSSYGSVEKYFALELWAKIVGDACSDDPTQGIPYAYFLFPKIAVGTTTVSDIDGQNMVTISLDAANAERGNSWGVGPYDVYVDESGAAGPLPIPLSPDALRLIMETTAEPPAPACGTSVVPANEVEGGLGEGEFGEGEFGEGDPEVQAEVEAPVEGDDVETDEPVDADADAEVDAEVEEELPEV